MSERRKYRNDAEYMDALESQLEAKDAEIERLRAALKKIMEYDPGQFRPLEDEIAIWRLATEALDCLPEPQSAPHAAAPDAK